MKFIFMALSYIFRISLVIGAVYLATNHIEGWGWLIFVAAITGVSISSKKEE